MTKLFSGSEGRDFYMVLTQQVSSSPINQRSAVIVRFKVNSLSTLLFYLRLAETKTPVTQV